MKFARGSVKSSLPFRCPGQTSRHRVASCGRKVMPTPHNRYSSSLQDSSDESSSSPTATETRNFFQLLSSQERELLQMQKDITQRSKAVARRAGLRIESNASQSLLEDLSTFSVVVAGEYNAGKSTLINTLLGTPRLLATGTLPTTETITILSSSPPPESLATQTSSSVSYVHLPQNPFLQDLTLVDTPGTNAIWKHHTAQTLRLLPAADWILFVTSADRPLSESERQLLESMANDYRKSIVLVINKMDLLDRTGGWHGKDEKERVVEFVTTHASSLLGSNPTVIAVSAHMPKQVEPLAQFLKETLTTRTKIQSKLGSPLGVAEQLVMQCLAKVSEEHESLSDDAATLKLLLSHVEGWKQSTTAEMSQTERKFKDYLTEQQGQRAHLFLQRSSLTDFYGAAVSSTDAAWTQTGPLMTSGRVQDDLKRMAQDAAAALATQGRMQGQAVIEFLGHRASKSSSSLVGSITAASRYEESYQRLLDRLQRVLDRAVAPEEDANVYAEHFQRLISRLAQTSIALHILTLVSFGLGGAEGYATAAVTAMLGLGTAGWGHSQAAERYSQVWRSKGKQLEHDLHSVWGEELNRLERQILQGISPFQRYVEAEERRIHDIRTEAEDILASSQHLRRHIQKKP